MPRRDVELKIIDQVTLREWFHTPSNDHQTSSDTTSATLPEVGPKRLLPCLIIYSSTTIAALGPPTSEPGCPEREIVPWEQQSDLSDAVTYLQVECSDLIDPDSIAVWGYSFAGGHVITVGASDPRIRAVIAAAPVSSLAAPEAYSYFSQYEKINNPSSNWIDDMGLRISYLSLFLEAQEHIQYISPLSLLMLVMDRDATAMTELELEAYEKAREPKELPILKGGHFDPFADGNLAETVEEQVEILRRWVVSS
ncbi:hypothetical protein CERZMDRAFT_101595 [Cercospora zeae-maydis SCOH1-5]|uniref:Peptidase S9 prolyl oligopeptidase catalytic domain-containing protein n=1 Tax=Cercospora zeae-maydis SCOH1-5 TaxID=717836 RepID=A0A6A6F6C2_9PEZI|nr:hypothetical protein CERZMDRAFT_101595 [Cercospora zeae-maydis SCOH1-5]